MSTFLLVHGAWHGAWCWDRVVPLLRERGHRVAAIDLPCHGEDGTPRWRASMPRYVERIRVVAEQLSEKPILVGHSMGGFSITQAAHDHPDRFAALFYVAAFVPQDGDSLLSLAPQDPESLVHHHAQRGLLSVGFAEEGLRETFYAECDEEAFRFASQRLCREPLRPLTRKTRLSRPLTLPRVYLECRRDRAISYARQREMARQSGIEPFVTLDTDHSPFFSRPQELAGHLHDLSQEIVATP